MDLGLKDIGQFTGTVLYYRGWLDTLITDGVFYMCRNGYNWFVNDAISVIRTLDYLIKEEFLTVRLHIEKVVKSNEDESEVSFTAVMRIEDGDEGLLYAQKYDYTDCCAERDLVLFYTGNVLMLASEY